MAVRLEETDCCVCGLIIESEPGLEVPLLPALREERIAEGLAENPRQKYGLDIAFFGGLQLAASLKFGPSHGGRISVSLCVACGKVLSAPSPVRPGSQVESLTGRAHRRRLLQL